MIVRELIRLLERFDPQAQVRLCVSTPGRVVETHEQLWVGDYGGGPQISTAGDIRQFSVYAGCGLEQFVGNVPQAGIDLGRYDTAEATAKVHDFYVIHRRLHEPLVYPDFDYEHWIPPRTTTGDYNPTIAKILSERLLRD